VQTAVEDALTEIGARNRLHDDAAALRRILADSPALLKKLDGIEERFSSLKAPDTVLFSSSFPQNSLHEELFALYAEHLRSKGTAKISVWSPYRYAFPNVFEEPKNDLKSLQFNMLRNTRRSALVQMLNSMDECIMPVCAFEGPENVLKALELSMLPWTDTAECIPVSTILLPFSMSSNYRLLRPGLMARLWLTVDASKLPAGKYSVKWKLCDNEYPIDIEVHEPSVGTPRLMVGSWDYTDKMPTLGLTERNVASAIAMMDRMHINVPWNANSIAIPKPWDFDGYGNFIGRIDSGMFEAWLKSRPGKPMYCCFINTEADTRVNIGGHELGSDLFMACATSWIRAWDRRMQELGMTPGKVQWLLVDEVTTDRKAEIQVAWSRAFKAANPKVLRNWNDPLIDVKDAKYKEMLDLVDSLCLPQGIQFNEADWKVYKGYQDNGTKLWSYLCNGPSRLFDPFSYYRMHALCAWRDNIVGIGFWSFGDCGSAKAFNEYTLHWAIFTPACIGKTTVYSTLALEALREGIEENEILQMLEERLPSFSAERRERAEKLLADFRAYIAANIQVHIKWYDAAEKVDREKADWFIDEAIKTLGR
ncbi:MAG: hypothetical protein J5833_04005, partial [Victivallales bacterium]|nr:hypothetical protein [Victivallales bacterium]